MGEFFQEELRDQYGLDLHIRMDEDKLHRSYDYRENTYWTTMKNSCKKQNNRYVTFGPYQLIKFAKRMSKNFKLANQSAPNKNWRSNNFDLTPQKHWKNKVTFMNIKELKMGETVSAGT